MEFPIRTDSSTGFAMQGSGLALTIVVNATRCLVVFSVVATLLPLLPVGAWFVRLFDFPRIQIAIISATSLAGIAWWIRASRWSTEHMTLLILCFAVLTWQLSHIVKYTPLWPHELEDSQLSSDDSHADSLTSTVINLKYENTEKQAMREQIAGIRSDLLLLIELDEPWHDALSAFESKYPYRKGVIRGEGLGIMLWSKLPFKKAEVRHLVSDDRASIFAEIRTRDGKSVNFVGVHPTPPGLQDDDADERHDSRIRDAELMLVAKIIADRAREKWIVAGDFNDVAWSHTTRLFQRVSGLKDPRVGRGLFNTYHAQYPLVRFPIDQVFLSAGAKIIDLRRFYPIGSDHFAITTVVDTSDWSSAKPEPKKDDLQEANQLIQEGKQNAESE